MRTSKSSILPPNRRRPRDAEADTTRTDSDPPPAVTPQRPRKKRAQRWLSRLSLLTGVVVVLAASLFVAWGLRRWLRQSPRFAVRHVEVDGNHRRTPHQLAKRADIDVGKNVFTIDTELAKSAIETDPWIETAVVEVDLPATVRIHVTEREPRALAAVDGVLYLCDGKGNLFKEVAEGDAGDLPVVTGIDADAIARDREGVRQRIERALELMADLEESEVGKRHPIQELHLEPDATVTVVVGTDGIALHFGTPPYRAKIAKAERVLEELRFKQIKSAVLFLDNRSHPERVVVRMKQ
jgi:cell division protein FtsQ